jgi:hypothetical protein
MRKLIIVVVLIMMGLVYMYGLEVSAEESTPVLVEITKEEFELAPIGNQEIWYGLNIPVEYPNYPVGTVVCITDLNGNYVYFRFE